MEVVEAWEVAVTGCDLTREPAERIGLSRVVSVAVVAWAGGEV